MKNPTVSDYFYHFTGWNQNDPKEACSKLLSILRTKEFRLSRNERQWTINQGYRPQTSSAFAAFYVKMVCFTETPIEYLGGMIGSKGGCCIGMKKEWLLRKGGQNVIYVDNANPNDYGRALTELQGQFAPRDTEDVLSTESGIRSNIVHALIAATEDVGFSHEREWRIIRNDLNHFMTEDYVKFEASDVENIWCDDREIWRLEQGFDDRPDGAEILRLVRKISELPPG
jgi:hypothetical protein